MHLSCYIQQKDMQESNTLHEFLTWENWFCYIIGTWLISTWYVWCHEYYFWLQYVHIKIGPSFISLISLKFILFWLISISWEQIILLYKWWLLFIAVEFRLTVNWFSNDKKLYNTVLCFFILMWIMMMSNILSLWCNKAKQNSTNIN